MITGEMLRSGLREAPPAPVVLAAGPLSAEFAGGEVRNVRVGDEEVVRRLYVAVRDRDWGTVPLALGELDIQQREDGFRVAFVATHRAETPEPIAFRWRGEITGSANGTLVCAMDGAAETAFLRNRIGWCALHPPATCAGQPCTITHPDGTTTTADFPARIAPHQPFLNIRAMAHGTPHGTRVSLTFDGDTFETEDQRNWTDDSYKTYGTPLALPFPVRVAAGEAVRQSVTLRVESAVGGRRSAETRDVGVTITVGAETVGAVPEIGLDTPLYWRLMEHERRPLGALKVNHVRVNLRDNASEMEMWRWLGGFTMGSGYADFLNVPLEIAFYLPDDPEAAQDALVSFLAEHEQHPVSIARFLVFDATGNTSPPAHLALARDVLGPAFPRVPVGGGTDAYFTQLNRTRPPQESLDFVTFSINPQVHAFDNRSVAETLAGQRAVIESAKALYPGLPVIVSPVTLRPRRNPDATAPPAPRHPGTPPPNVDTRQLSLFAAGWTAMSVKHLAEAGVASVTFYETVGPCGVMERESSSHYGDAFPSEPGQVFPLYHALADIGERRYRMRPATSSDALRVDALAMGDIRFERCDSSLRVLVANLHDAPETVTVRLPKQYTSATARVLDEAAAPLALRDPETWRTNALTPLPLTDDGTAFTLALAPYGYACVDVTGD